MINRGTTNFYLAIKASHLVIQGCFGLVTIKRTTASFAVVVQVTGPPMTPTVGDFYPLRITTLCTLSVSFRWASLVGVFIINELA